MGEMARMVANAASSIPLGIASGAAGSGLAILSRFPIIATHTNTYSLNSHPIYVGHGDWFVGKAAGCVTLDLGQGMIVDVWNTHVSRREAAESLVWY